jgi:hypothetical protein
MIALSHRAVTLLVTAILLLSLTSCAGPTTAAAGSPEFYWNAARLTYTAGDYMKTPDDLDHLIETQNEYSARALPWSLMLTSGVAAAYVELAEAYGTGARLNPANAVTFRRTASEYRTVANPLVLRFAKNIDKLDQLPPGSITLAFPPPKGSPVMPPALARVAAGMSISAADADAMTPRVVDRNVLLSACLAIGAANEVAKTREVLGHASTITPKSTFLTGLAQMVELNAGLYERDKLDNTERLAMLRKQAQSLREEAARAVSAMVVTVRENAQ